MAKYLRLKVINGICVGLPEVVSEEVALEALEEAWDDADLLLDEGERLNCGGYRYWKEE